MKNKPGIVILAILCLVGAVSADSDYCIPSAGTITDIVIDGTWTNITIIFDTCPICVETAIGLECTECEGEPTPTPTPTPEPTPCDPAPGVWCPYVYPTPIPTPTICFGFWCGIPPTPTISPTPTICPPGEWCPL